MKIWNIGNRVSPITLKLFYTPVEDGSYYVVPTVRPSVRASVCLFVWPSVILSCPLHNSVTVQNIFMKLVTNINNHQTICREQEPTLHLQFLRNYGLLEFLCPATKSGGVICYTLRTFECLSVRLSVRPSVRQRLNIRVRSITLIPFEIISRNLVQM